jgi:Ca2+/H+ antiporter, TMEM165/GDT1 family
VSISDQPVLSLAVEAVETVAEGGGISDSSTAEPLPEPAITVIDSADCTSGKEPNCPSWRVFTSTFITIFLAELGDKTQVSTLLMSAQFHQPWVIFLGAGSALISTTLLGVLVGQWLSTRLSPRTLDIAAGIILALISAWLIWDVFQL